MCLYKTVSLLKETPDTETFKRGFANGYVGVTKNHPLYGKSYNDEETWCLDVHGGVTFSDRGECVVYGSVFSDMWVFGFDTAHYQDDKETCNREYCEHQLDKLEGQLKNYKGE